MCFIVKVFITRVIPEGGLKLLRDAGIQIAEWIEKRDLLPEELIQHCLQSDALISSGRNKIDAKFLNACRHLKVISLHSVGFDNVDIAEATRLKIPVGNTPGVLSDTTADTAFMLLMTTSRKAFFNYRRILNNQWSFFEPTANLGKDLYGKTLGIFGMGRIGYRMVEKCRSFFNMEIIYCSRSHHPEAENSLGAKKVSFEELLQQSDVVSIHASLSSETSDRFNTEAFEKMKPSAIIINTARGSIIVEQDLIKALQQKTIWGAGLDVTNPEPMKPDNPLLFMPNVAVTPHIGSATEETRNAMSVLAARNVIAALQGQKIPNPVNPHVYD